jgi:hypothetical protein
VASAVGGTLTPGTYHLTTLTEYTGVGGSTTAGSGRSETVRVTATAGGFTLEVSVASTMGGFGQWLVFNGATATNQLTLTQVCPSAAAAVPFLYTASASTFTVYNTGNHTSEAYLKQ